MNGKAKGYILAAIAAATYGMNPLFALPLYQTGMDPDSVLFFRYLFAIPILGIMIKARGRDFKIQQKEILPLIALGLLVASLLTYPLPEFIISWMPELHRPCLFVYPIMVALIMVAFFKEKMTLLTILCILMALGGIALLFKGGGGDGSTLSMTGILLVMASALSYAIYIVGVNRPILKEVATLKITFLFCCWTFSVLIRVDFGATLIMPEKWYLWFNLIALAVFPTAISFLCTTSAIQYIGSTPTAILGH
jgi:drug/metabolite transporter (DMT)-like permease